MRIPQQIPGLKPAIWLLSAYAAVWISLEGALWRSLVLATGVTLLALAYLAQRWLAGRTVSLARWITVAAFWGTAAGLGSAVMTLAFMSLKTGLHAHGPEFTPQEVRWVVRQIPLWSLAGLSLGLGVGLLIWGRR
jgi:hypothetical protein